MPELEEEYRTLEQFYRDRRPVSNFVTPRYVPDHFEREEEVEAERLGQRR